ncbi:MAG TPA: phage portal protein [Gemmataceae bacterium]|nr:phage portal protein [Gemmataceae bacterium]
MRRFLANMLKRVASWLQPKAVPAGVASDAPGWTTFLDSYRHHREPSPRQLLDELKNAAWTCASINAAVCASFPPRLYVATGRGQPAPKCLTRALHPATEARLRAAPHLAIQTRAAQAIEEVTEHPLLTLLRQVNPVHNSFDLWELTELFLEVHGSAYWLIQEDDVLGIPAAVWILPSHNVTPARSGDSRNIVDGYEYRTGSQIVRYRPEEIIHFRFPSPRDPYTSGLSPLRACFEQVALTSEYAAMKRAIYDNTGIPSVVLSPAEVLGENERDRLEEQWNRKFRRGGAGKVLVAESGVRVDILSHSMGDLAALADMKATKEDIANAFHIPLPFLTGETNLANMQASDHLHKTLAIVPRLQRRDETLNEQLLPRYDDSGRLFVASEDPTPEDRDRSLKQDESDLKYGVRTINEIRAGRGLPQVPWGERPFRVQGDATQLPDHVTEPRPTV